MQIVSDQVAVVTGGASGIGLALARALSPPKAAGSSSLTSSRPPWTRPRQRCRREPSRYEPTSHSWATSRLWRLRRWRRFGRVDILCNNAGVSTFNAIENQVIDDWRWVLGVDLWGVIHGILTFLPIMKEQGGPAHIVSTSSAAGLFSGVPYIGPYAVAKVGVVSVSETLRAELAMTGSPIGVSVLCPGMTNTSVMESERNRPAELGSETRTDDAEAMRLFIREGFTGPTGKEPDEVAAMVLDAIKGDRFWVISHADLRPTIEARFSEILAAIPER